MALRWRDVDLAGQKLMVRRALSGETEVRSTKSRRAREIPLSDQAAVALQRLPLGGELSGPGLRVANRFGRRLDPLPCAAPRQTATLRRTGDPPGDQATRRGSSRTAVATRKARTSRPGALHDDPGAMTGERGVRAPLHIAGGRFEGEFR